MRPAGCARAPPPAPAICCEARSRRGRLGALLRAPMLRPRAFTSSLHPYFASRCLAKDERELPSGRPHRPRRWPRAAEWAGGRRGAKARPLSGLRALHPPPAPRRPQSGVSAREPGAWPAGTLPGSRPAPRAGDRRPRALWGLGRSPTGQAWGWSWLQGTPREVKSSLSGLGCRGPRLNSLGRV